MVESIMEIWGLLGVRFLFTHHKDGNTVNDSVATLQELNLDVALKHADDWKVDWWVCDLSSAEIHYVKNNIAYFLGLAKPSA
jgi:hypothetical protein